jgi:hypothetical protein
LLKVQIVSLPISAETRYVVKAYVQIKEFNMNWGYRLAVALAKRNKRKYNDVIKSEQSANPDLVKEETSIMQKGEPKKEVEQYSLTSFYLIVLGFVWIIFVSPYLTEAIRTSDYVTNGGESEAFLSAILSSIIYVAGFLPFLAVWYRWRKSKKEKAEREKSIQKAMQSFSTEESEPEKDEYSSRSTLTSIPVTQIEKPKENQSQTNSTKDIEEQLKELKSLYDQKLISKSVYDQKQKDIVDKM